MPFSTHSFILFLLIAQLGRIVGHNFDLSVPDLKVEHDDESTPSGEKVYLEAFGSLVNREIISLRDRLNYGLLAWTSIGVPRLVAPSPTVPSVFSFYNGGFYIKIESLTSKHKQALIEQAEKLHRIELKPDQIVNLPNYELTCVLEFDSADGLVQLWGHAAQERYPFRVQFSFLNHRERTCHALLDLVQSQGDDLSLEFKCNITSSFGLAQGELLNLSLQKFKEYEPIARIFGHTEFAYMIRSQIESLAGQVFSDLKVAERFKINDREFKASFVTEILQLTETNTRLVEIDAALKSLSWYKLPDDSDIDSILRSFNSIYRIETVDGVARIRNSDRNDRFKFESSEGSLEQQLAELNEHHAGEVEWLVHQDRVLPKRIRVTRLERAELEKSLLRSSITTRRQTSEFSREFSLFTRDLTNRESGSRGGPTIGGLEQAQICDAFKSEWERKLHEIRNQIRVEMASELSRVRAEIEDHKSEANQTSYSHALRLKELEADSDEIKQKLNRSESGINELLEVQTELSKVKNANRDLETKLKYQTQALKVLSDKLEGGYIASEFVMSRDLYSIDLYNQLELASSKLPENGKLQTVRKVSVLFDSFIYGVKLELGETNGNDSGSFRADLIGNWDGAEDSWSVGANECVQYVEVGFLESVTFLRFVTNRGASSRVFGSTHAAAHYQHRMVLTFVFFYTIFYFEK
jgi:hypothetical protein